MSRRELSATGTWIRAALIIVGFLTAASIAVSAVTTRSRAAVLTNEQEHLWAPLVLAVVLAALTALLFDWPPARIAATTIVLGAVGVIGLEIVQIVSPTRGPELRDVATGAIGVAIGAVASAVVHRATSSEALGVAASLVAAGFLIFVVVGVGVPEPLIDLAEETERRCEGDPNSHTFEWSVNSSAPDVTPDRCVRASTPLQSTGTTRIDDDRFSVTADGALVSAPLDVLAAQIRRTQSFTIEAEMSVPGGSGRDHLGNAVSLVDDTGAAQVWIATSGRRLIGAVRLGAGQGGLTVVDSYALMSPGRLHHVELTFSNGDLMLRIDGETVSSARLGGGAGPRFGNQIGIVVGNNGARTRPFTGTLSSVKVSSTREGTESE